MRLTESFRISWRAITGHKLRSSLTTLGIVIGIASVIVFMVLGGAFEANIVNDIKDEDNEPGMWVNTQQSVGGGIQFVQAPIYTETDVSQLQTIDGVEYVAPQANLPAVQLTHDGQQQTGGFSLQATTTDLAESRNYIAGGPFEGSNETILMNDTAQLLDGGLDVGDKVNISFEDGSTKTFTVAGIFEEAPGGGQLPQAYVSVEENYKTTIETPDGDRERAYASLIIAAEDASTVEDAKQDAIEYFESDSDAGQLKQDDYDIKVQTVDDAIDQISSVIDQLTVFIGGIAGISLLVGSIGIANIMIVSVTERTREIGIMKAVGARKRDIIQLFLVEAIILGAIGAVLGVIAGLGFGYLGVTLFGWPMVYPLDWIAIAVVIGTLVGVLSGLYPAWRGARVDPIEALRHE